MCVSVQCQNNIHTELALTYTPAILYKLAKSVKNYKQLLNLTIETFMLECSNTLQRNLFCVIISHISMSAMDSICVL